MPKRILIADDDPGIVDAVEMMLDFYGYNVSSTYNGAEVLTLQDNYPDVLLLDIWMSGCDGRDICKELKAKSNTQSIPVLMISASKDIRQSAMEAGADDFLAKPFDMQELLNKIERLLN
ncbi:response regulator transcription factor [Mucilaginibacter robiniae]|uniref:Response regulator transcription factor n=1 Tax=Mucilaginibacter robiniae TaxID=2728022 RepID=A0A7L5E3Q7_9SPHI|nr:response regulator transcription factor [Mucilaginibacter robiniae]QJD97047.1 response regulator transcription factor [Mucilaginibacter robiniae]